MKEADEDISIEDEWKFIALIIDTMLLYIYSFFAFFGTIFYFWTIGNDRY